MIFRKFIFMTIPHCKPRSSIPPSARACSGTSNLDNQQSHLGIYLALRTRNGVHVHVVLSVLYIHTYLHYTVSFNIHVHVHTCTCTCTQYMVYILCTVYIATQLYLTTFKQVHNMCMHVYACMCVCVCVCVCHDACVCMCERERKKREIYNL